MLASDLHRVSVSEDGHSVELVFTYPGEDGEELAPPVIVRMRGRNLGSVAEVLRAGGCPELAEEAPGAAGDPAAPRIDAIEGLPHD